jgi:hypothetical protein
MSQLVAQIPRSIKLALKAAPLDQVAEELLPGGVTVADAPDSFPELPAPLEAKADTRKAFANLHKIFNKVVMVTRRVLTEPEMAELGAEYRDIQEVKKLIGERESQIKEYVRTHQDVAAEETGQAFPKDVYRNGNLIAHATPRDANGHYLLAAPKVPSVTEIPGTNGLKFSNQFSSGKTTINLGKIDEAYAAGNMDEETYKAVTRLVRVPDAEKLREHALKTGDTSLLATVVSKGRPSASMYLRGLKKN